MDQSLLYNRQFGDDARIDYAPALVGRDRFVIADIERTFRREPAVEIAELSIGEGRMTTALLERIPKARLTCAEIAGSRIAFVRDLVASNATLRERMPTFAEMNFDTQFDRLPSATYHAVIALDIMEHVLDVFGFVDHCARLLKPGGRLYLRVPNIAYLKHRVSLAQGRLPVTSSWYETPGELTAWRERHGWDGGHLHFFTIDMLARLLREAGLTVVACRDPGVRFERLRSLWPALLYSNPLLVAERPRA
jgi:cyclopropane fatty-acyl-phospholipid synthase-like methyltransferase